MMTKHFSLFLFLPLFLFSCESTPDAYFHTDIVNPEVGQDVIFINESHNAKNFDWDFGDGSTSTEENPRHAYRGTGTFNVMLKVTSKSGLSDEASLTLEVLVPTLLEIEVREYYKQYTVSNANVIIYPSLKDWDSQKNLISEGITDNDGIVVFSGLDPINYYVDVWEKNHDNYTLADEDTSFIKTPAILPHKINRFVAWVDYYEDSAKGGGRDIRKATIKKFERKAADRPQPEMIQEPCDWQSLYNVSIRH